MPIDSKHQEYTDRAPQWKRLRDFVDGQDAVHAAGEAYLPRLINEPDAAYNARRARAGVFGAVGRTVEGLVGMMFRSAPEVKVSPAAEKMLADVTKSGEPLDVFGARTAIEYETTGRVAVLTDYPPAPTEALTVAQVEALNIQPHLARYNAESLINWQYGWVNNRTTLTMAVLKESASEPNPLDPFVPTAVEQYRELRLVDGVYTVQMWRRPPGGGSVERVGEPLVPLLRGQPLNEIPLEIMGDGRPPLLSMCDVNLSHYQTTADIEHGAHMTALPQPWIAGEIRTMDPETGRYSDPVLYIGGGNAWTFPTGTAIGMLEYTGQGLAALETRIKIKEQQMAVLGARMLESQKSGVEAADTAGMHRAGEQSVLQRQAAELSQGLEKALGVFDRWAGGSGDVTYQINKDFLPTKLTAQELTALLATWQAGGISEEEYFGNLQRGGWISEGADYETEQAKRANHPPVLAAPPAAPGNPNDAGA